MKLSITSALGLAISLGLIAPACSLADGTTYSQTRTVTGDGLTTTTEITSTNSQPVSEITQDVYLTTLDSRRVQLENAIATGEASGSLSPSQARSLRAELDRIARAQAEGKDTTFNYQSALPLAMSLDYVGNVIRTAMPTVTFVPIIDGRRFIVSDGRVFVLDDVMVRRAELESRIARELANGRLSGSRAHELRLELSRIGGIEEQMRAHGSLTFKDSRALYQMFDKVGSLLDRSIVSSGSDSHSY